MDMRTTLSPVEFRDEVRLRLGLPLLNTPSHCDGCTKPWSVSHALSCPFGGLVTVHHNEARDEIMETCCAAYAPSRVCDEPRINVVRATGCCKIHTSPATAQKGEAEGTGDTGGFSCREAVAGTEAQEEQAAGKGYGRRRGGGGGK